MRMIGPVRGPIRPASDRAGHRPNRARAGAVRIVTVPLAGREPRKVGGPGRGVLRSLGRPRGPDRIGTQCGAPTDPRPRSGRPGSGATDQPKVRLLVLLALEKRGLTLSGLPTGRPRLPYRSAGERRCGAGPVRTRDGSDRMAFQILAVAIGSRLGRIGSGTRPSRPAGPPGRATPADGRRGKS